MPGGESADELDKRVKKTISRILKEAKGIQSIAILTHGGVLRSFFQTILKDKRKILDIKDVAFAEIDYSKNKMKIIRTEGFIFE